MCRVTSCCEHRNGFYPRNERGTAWQGNARHMYCEPKIIHYRDWYSTERPSTLWTLPSWPIYLPLPIVQHCIQYLSEDVFVSGSVANESKEKVEPKTNCLLIPACHSMNSAIAEPRPCGMCACKRTRNQPTTNTLLWAQKLQTTKAGRPIY